MTTSSPRASTLVTLPTFSEEALPVDDATRRFNDVFTDVRRAAYAQGAGAVAERIAAAAETLQAEAREIGERIIRAVEAEDFRLVANLSARALVAWATAEQMGKALNGGGR